MNLLGERRSRRFGTLFSRAQVCAFCLIFCVYATTAISQEVKSPIERAAEQLRRERLHGGAPGGSALPIVPQGRPSKADTAGSSNEPILVRVDPSVEYQTMQGFGSSARLFDDPHLFQIPNGRTSMTAAQQDEILDLLYEDLKLTRVRLFFERGFEVKNDNDDPEVENLSKFDFGGTRNDALVAFATRLAARGVGIVYPTKIRFEKWMDAKTEPAEFAEQIVAHLRRWRKLGVELNYYSIVNEPGYTRGGYWSGAFIRDVILRARPKLLAEGFRTRFVVPDDFGPKQAYERAKVILEDPRAREMVGAIAFHLYQGNQSDLSNLRQLSRQYGIPLWMTEYSLSDGHFYRTFYRGKSRNPIYWALLLNDMIVKYNVSSVDYMFGFFGEWDQKKYPRSTLIILNNIGLKYRGYSVTKQYYMMGQFSRFVAPDARRIKAETLNDNVHVSAFRKDNHLTIVAINTGLYPRHTKFSLEIENRESLPPRMAAVRTSNHENWKELDEILLTETDFKAMLPPNSITTFYGNMRVKR